MEVRFLSSAFKPDACRACSLLEVSNALVLREVGSRRERAVEVAGSGEVVQIRPRTPSCCGRLRSFLTAATWDSRASRTS